MRVGGMKEVILGKKINKKKCGNKLNKWTREELRDLGVIKVVRR